MVGTTMARTHLMKALKLIMLMFIPINAGASWPDVDIELVTCQPDGIIATAKRSMDPLAFWVKQNVALEMALEQEDLPGLMEDCRINNKDDKPALTRCRLVYQNRHAAMVRCLRHTAIMCRQHGGRC